MKDHSNGNRSWCFDTMSNPSHSHNASHGLDYWWLEHRMAVLWPDSSIVDKQTIDSCSDMWGHQSPPKLSCLKSQYGEGIITMNSDHREGVQYIEVNVRTMYLFIWTGTSSDENNNMNIQWKTTLLLPSLTHHKLFLLQNKLLGDDLHCVICRLHNQYASWKE